MTTRPSRAAIAAALLVLAGAGALASTPRPGTLGTTIAPEAWEYAELRIVGTDGVLITAGDAYFLEGPGDRQARKFISLNNDKLRVTQSMRVRHLTRAGSQGWELVERLPGDRDAFLLRRRYRVETDETP